MVFFSESCLFEDNYNWDFGDGFNSILSNPSHIYKDTGCYQVRLIATNLVGCLDTTSRLVCIEDDFAIYIPNAFSPNGDDINDVFLPKGNGISPNEYELLIFDRWGLLLFKSNICQKVGMALPII